MGRWRRPVISRQGMAGCAARNADETLPAASPITSSARITALWCSRLARNAASSMPATKPRASLAASSTSSSSAASRSAGLPIDRLRLFQNPAAADEIAAGLDGFALDQIDGAADERLQRLLEIHEGGEIVAGVGSKRHQEIDVTAGGVEIRRA